MDTQALSKVAEDLENYLKGKVTFYLKVGWMREAARDILVVYYDEREVLPKGVVPNYYRNVLVRVQGTLPPGVQPTDPDDLQISWVW